MINHQESPSYAAVASQRPPLVADVFLSPSRLNGRIK
jgi:hypothetical protein